MGWARREGLAEGCFQSVLQPLTEGVSAPGFPTGIQGEVIPLSLESLCGSCSSTWLDCQVA